MSSFFADENALVQLSPNLESDATPDSCLKPANESVLVSVALFQSPGGVARSKSPDLIAGEDCQTDESHLRRGQEEVSVSVDEDHDKPDSSSNETNEQRQQRECDESELLAWEMMREESMTAYRMQMDFMSSSSNEMSAEDREAVQMAMGGYGDGASNEEEVNEEVAEQGDEEEEEDENQDSDVSQWDYDRLLALGEIIGDVKTERWRLKAKAVIKKLPLIKYAEMQLRQSQSDASNSSEEVLSTSTGSSHQQKKVRYDPSCAVCMEVFVKEDMLHVLPCQHYFHVECTKGWVADHNCCPMCKSAVSFTP